MEVSSVERRHHRLRVTIGGEVFTLTQAQFDERPLSPGDEIDIAEYDQWLMVRQYTPALQAAVAMLARRPHAAGEIEAKLRRSGCRPCTVEMVLYKLRRHGLLDDEAFARQWAAYRAGSRLGQRRITQELRRKGVDADIAEAAAGELDGEAMQQAARELAAKYLRKAKPGEDPRKTEQRALAALIRRGYGYDEARAALAQARQEAE